MEYAKIVASFQAAYAIGLLMFGWFVDRVGSRVGLLLAVSLWSVASVVHGLVSSVRGFSVARFGLGLAEAGNFPAAVKAVSEWFPEKERAFAIGLFNSGSNIGAIVTPLVVPWIAVRWGWRAAFFATGVLGVVWLVCAITLSRAVDQVGNDCARHDASCEIHQGAALHQYSWGRVIRMRETWGFALAKLLTDPIWWFYLYWTPKYLSTNHHVQLVGLAAPLVTIYVMADVGSIVGGWISSRLVRAGVDSMAARKRVMLCCALLAPLVVGAGISGDLWLSVVLLSLAAAAHQGWSTNLFATVTDLFPKDAVGSVVGIGGMLGALGGMAIATFAGLMLHYSGSYLGIFIVCASAYLVAFVLFCLLTRSDRLCKRVGG
jgi:ACS family hexuronate transporter-like MFS transporter